MRLNQRERYGIGQGSKRHPFGDEEGDNTPTDPSSSSSSALGSFHKGGRVKKTGNYRLRKNEVVLTVSQQKAAGFKKGKRKSSPRKRISGKG